MKMRMLTLVIMLVLMALIMMRVVVDMLVLCRHCPL